MIKFEKVTKKFGDGTTALTDIDFQVSKGEFVFITGPSGAGKTSILRLLTREYLPTSGKIFYQNEDITKLKKSQIPQLRRRIGAVFQDFKLLADRTVLENVCLALEINGAKDINLKAKEVLQSVGLSSKIDLFPRQLAGGELQRIALARTMAINPEVIFADEPTGNLDPETGWQIVQLFKKLNNQGMTIIMSTHNFEVVDSLKERVLRIEKGKIVSDEKKGKYKK